jgi:hypothetical protein
VTAAPPIDCAAPIVSSELSGRALRLFSTTAACGADSCQADHVGGSSGVADPPGGFCRGLQQASGQFRKSQQSGPGVGRLVSRTSGCSRAAGSASSPAAECQVTLTLPHVAGHRWLWRGWRCR